MKKHAKRIFGAASAALLAVCSAAAVFPQLTASARYTTVNPLTEAPVTYKKGYIYAGDVNKDGALNRNDYDILLGIASSDMYPKDLPMYVMDLNGDGTVSMSDAEMLGDFVSEDNLIILGDVYAPHTDGITGMDAQAILNYVRGTVPTDVNYRKQVSPFIDYIGDLFNRGDGLTEEDAMIIMRYIENIDKYGPLEPRMWVHEYEFDEEGRIIYNDNPKTRYAGNHLLSRSVTLDGTLGLNLYAHIDDDTESIIFDGPNGHMVLIRYIPHRQTEQLSYALRRKAVCPLRYLRHHPLTPLWTITNSPSGIIWTITTIRATMKRPMLLSVRLTTTARPLRTILRAGAVR